MDVMMAGPGRTSTRRCSYARRCYSVRSKVTFSKTHLRQRWRGNEGRRDDQLTQKQSRTLDNRRRSPGLYTTCLKHQSSRPSRDMWMVQHRSDVLLRHPYRPVSAHRIGAQQRVVMRPANQMKVHCTSRGMARASTPPRGHKCGARRVGISLVSPWRPLGLIAGHG